MTPEFLSSRPVIKSSRWHVSWDTFRPFYIMPFHARQPNVDTHPPILELFINPARSQSAQIQLPPQKKDVTGPYIQTNIYLQ